LTGDADGKRLRIRFFEGIPIPPVFSVRVANKGLMLDAARKSGRYET